MTTDRRRFLRITATALAGSWSLGGCRFSRDEKTDGIPGTAAQITRPVLLPLGADAVQLDAPLASRPQAYLSRSDGRIYLDRGARDDALRLLGAYVSVSTGHWRVHLPGDDPRVPVVAGDPEREFVETDIAEWPGDARPAEGDIRMVSGPTRDAVVEVGCSPILGAGTWVSCAPLRVPRLQGEGAAAGLEVFTEVAVGVRSSDRDCGGAGSPVRIVTWSATLTI